MSYYIKAGCRCGGDVEIMVHEGITSHCVCRVCGESAPLPSEDIHEFIAKAQWSMEICEDTEE